jgi:hypothetical protein
MHLYFWKHILLVILVEDDLKLVMTVSRSIGVEIVFVNDVVYYS